MNSIPNLLRPEQILETTDEASRLQGMLGDPRAQLSDRPLAMKQLRNMRHLLETQTPVAYGELEVDAAVKKEKELRELMVSDGMPTQAEMRKNPPGSVDKLRGWEARHKGNLMLWKHIQLRLNAGTADADVANFEKHRPAGGANELSMDNAQIAGKQYRLPPEGADLPIVMSDEEHEELKKLDPEVADMMALASNEQRREILSYVRNVMSSEKAKPVLEAKPKRKLSPEHIEKMKAGKRKANEAKRLAAS